MPKKDVNVTAVNPPVDQVIPDQSVKNLEGFLNEMKTDIELKEMEKENREDVKIDKKPNVVVPNISDIDDSDETTNEQVVVPSKPKSNIDISSITVKVPKDKKDYLLLRKKRIEAQATYQVALPKSGYYAEMTKLSSIEIQNLALSSQTNSKYVYRQKLLRLVYDKIKNTSLGKISFTDFLHITAESELNILLYGIYCMTYKDVNEYNITCENCSKNYNLSVHNKNLLVLEVNQDADTILSIQNIITEAKTAEELKKQSFVSNLSRLQLSNECIYEIKEPSLYDSLDRLYKNIDEEKYKDDITLGFVKFIDAVLIFDESDDSYIRCDDFDTIYSEFKSLIDEDYYMVSECIKGISQDNRVRFGLKNIVCPHCDHKTEDQIIDDMELLVFLQHQSQMDKFRTKGTGSN
jgi:hypothetical protein